MRVPRARVCGEIAGMLKSASPHRVITLLIGLVTAVCTAFPQEGGFFSPKWIILSGGVSFPAGLFSSTDFPSGGYAKAGGGVGIEAVSKSTNSTNHIYSCELEERMSPFTIPQVCL